MYQRIFAAALLTAGASFGAAFAADPATATNLAAATDQAPAADQASSDQSGSNQSASGQATTDQATSGPATTGGAASNQVGGQDPSQGRGSINLGAGTTVGGQVFADFSDIAQKQNGTDVPPSGVGFDIKRAYLIVNHIFNPVLSANLTTDAQYISSSSPSGTGYTGSTTANSGGVTDLFIKLLYLQARVNDAFVFHAGSYTSPWIGFVQNLYGYRYVEKTTTDRLGFANTADWGLNASGIAGGNGIINYSLSAVDGGGYKNPTRTKQPDFEGALIIKPLTWLNLGGGFYSGHLGQVTETNENYPQNTATRWDLVAAVVTNSVRVGAEYFDAKDFKAGSASTGVLSSPGSTVPIVVAATATGALLGDRAEGYSAWASYSFTPRWSVFGRFDQSKLSEDIDPNLKDEYYNFGVAFEPARALDLALVYKHELVEDGSVSISGGDGNSSYAIGGTGVAGTGVKTSGQFNEVGIYTQYVF